MTAGSDLPLVNPATVAKSPAGGAHTGVPSGGRVRRLSGTDRIVVITMVLVPLFLTMVFVVLPAIASVVLSFTSWDGIGGIGKIKWVGFQNYVEIFTINPAFWPAMQHNLLWLVVLFFFATPVGIFFAVLLDKEIRGSRLYQTPDLPASGALPGPGRLHLAAAVLARLRPDQRDPARPRPAGQGQPGRLVRRPEHRDLGRPGGHGLEARRLHHAAVPGGPEGCRPVVARGGGGRRCQRDQDLLRDRLPGPATDQHHRRRDHGDRVVAGVRPGLDRQQGAQRPRAISALVTSNVTGEASRVGYGSALATIMLVISLVFIAIYLRTVFTEEEQ